MKLLFSTVGLFFLTTSVFAQQWLTNFNQAKEIASEEDRVIILVFQGSDWCAPCMKLDKAIWSSQAFQSYAKDHFVMLQADFPRKKANQLPEEQQVHNGQLAEIYNQQGYFPLVVILDKEGTVMGKTGFRNLSVEDYIKLLESFKG